MSSSRAGKAVVLLSGGIDSATTLAIAGEDGHELYAITFDYHQRHARELASARLVAAAHTVEKHLVVVFDLHDIGGSALTSAIEVPKSGRKVTGRKSKEADLSRSPNTVKIPVTYVPARNTIFLSFALGWAEVLEAENIYIGANAVDYSGYPDCRPEYLHAFEQMANLATRASVEGKFCFRINAPLIALTKAQTIQKGMELGVDYGLTWSCYDPQPVAGHGAKGLGQKTRGKTPNKELLAEFKPCGRCDSCRIREKGFREAGIEDPLIQKRYRSRLRGGNK
ncbi:MAG TPA: 7-cyano-7-deazaguanine synthase QueC [Thermodesulfovibrionales bacterium]|nr:7-cyano-7-deazaguanine synthase QueC [Thermodesulfovibrionales bacterium]